MENLLELKEIYSIISRDIKNDYDNDKNHAEEGEDGIFSRYLVDNLSDMRQKMYFCL